MDFLVEVVNNIVWKWISIILIEVLCKIRWRKIGWMFNNIGNIVNDEGKCLKV